MPDLTKKPDLEFMVATKTHLAALWDRSHSGWEDRTREYNRAFQIWRSEHRSTRASWIPSTPTSIVNRAIDTQFAPKPTWVREPKPTADGEIPVTEQRRSDNIEIGIDAVMVDAVSNEVMNPWKEIAKHLIMFDYAVVEGPVLDGEAWIDRPIQPSRDDFETDIMFEAAQDLFEGHSRNWNPVRIRVPLPNSVLMDPGSRRPKIAIKTESIPAGELEAISARKAAKQFQGRTTHNVYKADGKNYYDSETLNHFWSPFWHSVWMENGLHLYTEKNWWGFLPFKQVFSGRGVQMTGEEFDPVYWTRGMLWAISDSIRQQAQARSAKHQLLIQQAYAGMGTRQDPNEMAEALANDEMIQGQPGDIWTVQYQQITGWMERAGLENDSDIETGTFTEALSGIRTEGVRTVGQQQLINTAAKAVFDEMQSKVADLASEIGQDTLKLATVLSRDTRYDRISIAGRSLRASDIKGDFLVQASFDKIDPALHNQERQIAMSEWDRNLISDETYRKTARRMTDESGEQDRILREQIRRRPSVHEVMAREMAPQVLPEGVFDEALELEQGPDESVGTPPSSLLEGSNSQVRTTQALDQDTVNPQRV